MQNKPVTNLMSSDLKGVKILILQYFTCYQEKKKFSIFCKWEEDFCIHFYSLNNDNDTYTVIITIMYFFVVLIFFVILHKTVIFYFYADKKYLCIKCKNSKMRKIKLLYSMFLCCLKFFFPENKILNPQDILLDNNLTVHS